jgi:cell division protein FtsB
MKKKVQKMLEWFYDDSDRGEKNISECKSIYELVEKLQLRMESLENDNMILLAEINKLKLGVCDTESN